MSGMTLREFCDKVEWEGGGWVAIVEYGIHPRDVEDQGLKDLLAVFHSRADEVNDLLNKIMCYAEDNAEREDDE